MANPTVRAGVFYWRNRKAAETNKAAIKFMHGRKPVMGADGVAAFSKGAAMAEITITEFVPVGGSTTSADMEKILAQEDFDAAILIGGKFYRQKWAVTENTLSYDTETGVCEGQLTLQGGKPSVKG